MANDLKYVDSRYGLDTNSGEYAYGDLAMPDPTKGPWQTLAYAAAQARAGGVPVTYVAGNGTAYPYRTSGTGNLMAPNIAGSAGDYATWSFDADAVVMGTSAVTATWELVPGKSYTWRALISEASVDLAYICDSALRYGITELVKLTAMPTDAYHRCYYYNATTGYMYVVDHEIADLNAATIEIFTTGVHNGYLYVPGSSAVYNKLEGGIWAGGRYTTIRMARANMIVSKVVTFGSLSYTPFGFEGAANQEVSQCVSIAKHTTSFGHFYVQGDYAGRKIYNNTVIGNSYGTYFAADACASSPALIKNNIFIDILVRPHYKTAGAVYTLGYNAYGSSRQGFTGVANGYSEINLSHDDYTSTGAINAGDQVEWRPVHACVRGDVNAVMSADHTTEAKTSGGTPFSPITDTAHYMYLCFSRPVEGVYINFSANGNYTGLTWQYLKYTDTTNTWSWETLTVSGTAATLSASGKATWTIPAAWYAAVESYVIGGTIYVGFWIRAKCTAITTAAEINQIRTLRAYGDVGIISVDDDNLELYVVSPCRDTGVDLGFTTDINGNAIPFRALPDIGAYEARYRNFGINRTINIEIEL